MVAMRKKLCIATFISIFWVGFSFAQYADVYPTNWWVGMKNNKVQLLIKSADSSLYKSVVTIKYPHLKMVNTWRWI
jgi:hypothetical protein